MFFLCIALSKNKQNVLNNFRCGIQTRSSKIETAENRFSIHAEHRMFEDFEKNLVNFI